MVNQVLLEDFIGKIGSGVVLEAGLPKKVLESLHAKFSVVSFDAKSSRFAMVPPGFRSSGMVRLTHGDATLGGFISKNVLDNVGDRGYFFDELKRVVKGVLFMTESSLDSFPRDYLAECEDSMIYSIAVNGQTHELNLTWAELLTRRDLRRIFYNPSGTLSKFNTLVPEDISVEIGVLFRFV
jgi:hypothetical protein